MRPLLLALALGLAADGSGQELVLERSFSAELELLTESFEISAGDEGHTVTQEGPRYLREQADEVELRDVLADDERPPARFTRLYRTVASSFRMGTEGAPRERTASAGLEGKSVLFERDEDGSYARSSEDADARPGQLKRLRADVALAPFLPGDEARAPGASWEVPWSTFARLVSPVEERWRRAGKAPGAVAGALNVAPAALTEPVASLLAAAEGQALLTWSAPEDAPEDARAHQARVEFEFTSTFDGAGGLLGGLAGEGEAEDEVRATYAGTGTLAWDEGGAIRIEVEGELRLVETFRVEVEAGDRSGEMRGKLVVSGTLALAGEERRED